MDPVGEQAEAGQGVLEHIGEHDGVEPLSSARRASTVACTELDARCATVTPSRTRCWLVGIDAQHGIARVGEKPCEGCPIAAADVEDVETPLPLLPQPRERGQDEASLLGVAEDVLPGQLRARGPPDRSGAQRAVSIA